MGALPRHFGFGFLDFLASLQGGLFPQLMHGFPHTVPFFSILQLS
jgi:hypothetical protein